MQKLLFRFLVVTGLGEWIWREIDNRKRAEVKEIIREIFGEDETGEQGRRPYEH